jgi:hypothetical protein
MRPIPPRTSASVFQLTSCRIEGIAQCHVHVVRAGVASRAAVGHRPPIHVNHDAVDDVTLTATSRCFDDDMTPLDLRSDVPKLSGATPDCVDDGLRRRHTSESDLWQHVRFLSQVVLRRAARSEHGALALTTRDAEVKSSSGMHVAEAAPVATAGRKSAARRAVASARRCRARHACDTTRKPEA